MKKIIISESQFNRLINEGKFNNNNIIDPHKIIFMAYGKGDSFIPEKFDFSDTDTNGFREHLNLINKPNGFWAAPLKKEGGSAWSEWINYEMPNWVNSLTTHFLFKIDPSAKILTLNTPQDLQNLPKMSSYRGTILDWKKIESIYDGVFASDYFIIKLNLTDRFTPSFHSWDMESICVFNKNVIIPVGENIYDYDKNAGDYSIRNNWYGFDDDDASPRVNKKYQMDKLFKQYGNLNVEPHMEKFFNGEHPALMAQGHKNAAKTKMAQKFKGTLK